MAKVRFRQTGNSLAVTVPKGFVDLYGIKPGDELEVDWGGFFAIQQVDFFAKEMRELLELRGSMLTLV